MICGRGFVGSLFHSSLNEITPYVSKVNIPRRFQCSKVYMSSDFLSGLSQLLKIRAFQVSLNQPFKGAFVHLKAFGLRFRAL